MTLSRSNGQSILLRIGRCNRDYLVVKIGQKFRGVLDKARKKYLKLGGMRIDEFARNRKPKQRQSKHSIDSIT